MKKAQIETMGLVMIVIVLALALVFALAFFSSQQQQDNEQYVQVQANTALSAFLSTQIAGCPTTFQQELASCSTSHQPLCISSCKELQQLTQELLSRLLPAQQFQLSTHPDSPFSTKKITCLNRFSSPEHFLTQEISITLELCNKDATKE